MPRYAMAICAECLGTYLPTAGFCDFCRQGLWVAEPVAAGWRWWPPGALSQAT